MCFQFGGSDNICDSNAGFIYGYNSACSVPGGGGKSTTFTCTADFGSGASPAPDGPVWACVIAADASIPDNPNGPDQRQARREGQPLRRQVRRGAARPHRAAGLDRVGRDGQGRRARLLRRQASDADSGLGSGYEWSYGDNTRRRGSGESVSHTFTQPGTYEVRVKTADAAGNIGTATKVVTVTAPASGGGGTGGGGTAVADGGGTGGGADGGGDHRRRLDRRLDRRRRRLDRRRRHGRHEAGGLEVTAPRKLKLARAKALPIAADRRRRPGKASFALVRSGR